MRSLAQASEVVVHAGCLLSLVPTAIACSHAGPSETEKQTKTAGASGGQPATSGGSAGDIDEVAGSGGGSSGTPVLPGGGPAMQAGGSSSAGAAAQAGGGAVAGAQTQSGGTSSAGQPEASGGDSNGGQVSQGGSSSGGVDAGGSSAMAGSGGEPPDRMAWWREGRFGMFIHWGAYAELHGTWQGQRVDGLGEWIMSDAKIAKSDYEEQAAAPFNPIEFDAAAWVSLAKEAGQKYIVITSKHHDGFSMFGTQAVGFSPYSIVDYTAWGRDPLQELAAECKAQGIRFGAYYSIMDWHHPLQSDWGSVIDDKEQYVSEMKTQLQELIENYDVDLLWFDGEWQDWWTKEDGRELYSFLLDLKPSLIINNRVGKREVDDGDFGTPEQEIPPTGLDYDWESCMTLNDTWGYKDYDNNWKPVGTLINNLVDIASKGGNYLLNVGPTETGIIPQPSAERLRAMGSWLGVYGESIYETSASVFAQTFSWGKVTVKPGKIYLLVTDWPRQNPQISIPPIAEPVQDVYPLDDPDVAYPYSVDDSGVTIDLPDTPPNEYVSVVVVSVLEDTAGAP